MKIGLFVAALAIAAPAAAQGSAPRCELHVFPSRLSGVINSTTTPGSPAGPLGDAIGGALSIKDPKIGEKLMNQHLDQDAQVKILRDLDLPALLRIDAEVIFEQPVAWDFDIPKYRSSPRLIASTNPCYKELIVVSTYVEKGTLSKVFKTWVFYRSYGEGAAPVYAVNKAASYPLHAFPPKSENEVRTGIEEVLKGYRENVLAFTKAVKRP